MVKLGAASAADVPSDRRHPRLPHQHAPASEFDAYVTQHHLQSTSSIWLRMQGYCVRPVHVMQEAQLSQGNYAIRYIS